MADDRGSTKDKVGKKVNSLQKKGHCQISVERMKSASFTGTSGNSSVTSLNSDGDGKVNYGSCCSSADSGVEMGPVTETLDHEARLLSYTVGDITDCLYESLDDFCLETQNCKKHKSDSNIQGPPPIRSRCVTVEKSLNHGSAQTTKVVSTSSSSKNASLDEDDSFSVSLSDSTVLEGFNSITFLNDVLKGCGNMDKYSTEEFDIKDTKKEALKVKKSSDFEAKMASVAATLDLTKQQQRPKRQISRPPVSPPPEPNLAKIVSPKRIINQPDLVTKAAVTEGKGIVTIPLPQDSAMKIAKPIVAPCAVVEDSGGLLDNSDTVNNRTVTDGKNKKGITSFFRNILRKGKGSSENLESMNSDTQVSKLERKDSADVIGSVELPDEGIASSSVDQNLALNSCPQGKLVFTPPTSPPQQRIDIGGSTLGDVTTVDSSLKVASDIHQYRHSQQTSLDIAATSSPATASPPVQRKISKGLASPKMMLKKATAKFSPPVSRHTTKSQDKELEMASLTQTSMKPNLAPKPLVPPPAKPTAAASDTENLTVTGCVKESDTIKDKESSPAPSVVRRRPVSPKRAIPPVPPTRTSIGKTASTESRNLDLTKELEWRQSQSAADQSEDGTLSRSDLREATRRSLPLPPSPPGERKEKSSTTGSPPISPIPDTENSLPSSPTSSTGANFDFTHTEWSGGSSSTIDDELPKFSEKIELPTVAIQSRKGFLGKLGGNRKIRTSQAAPVKRAKSITESSTLPRGDKKSKKINVADISGPVMVTDITNTRVLGNRRNTISLGGDPAFAILPGCTVNPGSATSSVSIDKSGFDEFDIPILSPLGSLENLYESILPKPEGTLFHYYDPPTGPKMLCPNIPADGYLEPVPPLSSTAAASTTSSSSLALVPLSSTTALPVSSSTIVTKSPLKTKTSFARADRTPVILPRYSKDSGSSHSTQTSASSSETNSAENSGSSIPDPAQILSKNNLDAAGSSKIGSNSISSLSITPTGLGSHFIEPEMTDQRRILLASQPIYEEIPNGSNEVKDINEDDNASSKKGRMKAKMIGLRNDVPPKKLISVEGSSQKVLLQVTAPSGDKTKSQTGHPWFQQPTTVEPSPHAPISPAPLPSVNVPPLGMPSSPSHVPSKQSLAPASLSLQSSSMTSSQIMLSSIMTASMTSSMLPPPPPPPDHLPAPHHTASRSASRETVSSESDIQSSCSTFSRPRPAPRQKPRRPYTGGADQYVSMNRPNTQVSLSEDKLRDVFTKLTNITFHALQDIYAQCERILSVDRLNIPNSKMLKWADFDIYGQPLHASGRCVVYNAKLRANSCPCQIMILHSRPPTEMCATSHPSLLRPSAIFADTIPFSFLTPDFIKTSQLLQNSVYDSSLARCFIAVGAFDIVESLESHLALLRETLAQDLNSYLNVILTASLQLLSAMSHCLDQGFSVTETDYNDVFLITRSDLRGKVVAFLPHQRSLDVPQGEAMCNFLERLLTDALPLADDDDIDDEADVDDEDGEKIISSPKKVVAKLLSLLESRRVECLGQIRTAVEYLLWGPAQSELPMSPVGPKPAGKSSNVTWSGASREQELYVWLEKERVSTVGRLARNVPGLAVGLTLEEFYTLKFLLKSSAACLAESLRRLSR